MSRTAHAAGETKSVPFNQIFVERRINGRKKLKDIPKLAKSIQEKGLLSSLLVTNGGEGKQPYTLSAGFRRAAALESLNWGSKLVNVIVVDSAEDANLIENVRDDLPALDLSEKIVSMLEGTYYVPGLDENAERKKYTKAEIATMLGRSASHVQNFIRVHKDVTDDVKALVRDHDPSARVLFAWASMSPAKQMEAATAWVKDQEQLAKSGKTRKAKGEGKGGGVTKTAPGKKILVEKFEQLSWKGETVKGKAGEVATAAAQVLGFVLGVEGFKRFPTDIFSAEDAKEYKAALKAADEEASEEEVDESGEE